MKLFNKILRRLPLSKEKKEAVLLFQADVARRWISTIYRDLLNVQWSIPPKPVFIDHNIDLYYRWLSTRESVWLESGAFGSLALLGGDTLELACGDGFNARNFYSLRSKKVVACDFEPKALEIARKNNSAPNIEYVFADIRESLPEGCYDNIIWDEAISYFSLPEINEILQNIKKRLSPVGIFSGHIVGEHSDINNAPYYKHIFKNKEEVLEMLKLYFETFVVFETKFPSPYYPKNFYFWASDNAIPFGSQWSDAIFYRHKEYQT